MKKIILCIKNLFITNELVILKNKLEYLRSEGWNFLTYDSDYSLHKECPKLSSNNNWISYGYENLFDDYGECDVYLKIPKWENMRILEIKGNKILSLQHFDDSALIGYDKEIKEHFDKFLKENIEQL